MATLYRFSANLAVWSASVLTKMGLRSRIHDVFPENPDPTVKVRFPLFLRFIGLFIRDGLLEIRVASPIRTNECTGPPELGPCLGTIARWHFDELSQVCKNFKYSGCGGNGNNYPNEESCKQRCAIPAADGEDSICGQGPHQRPLKDAQGQTVSCTKTECPSKSTFDDYI